MINPIHAATARLQDALIELSTATDARGLKVVLVQQPRDIDEVRHALHNMARWFQQDVELLSVFGEDGEQNAARNIALVAELLRALLAYKAAGGKDLIELRDTPDACSLVTY